MGASQRGFALVETIVTVAVVALLLAAGGVWMLGMRPGALAQAEDDYDAALASARAVAETSGNGATLVFAPRTGGSPAPTGFTLRVYGGRPSAAGAVQPTTAMPVVADATVAENTLGAPPFAIFLGASGDVSGKASYPTIDASGNASFATIASEPPCPAGGFVFTFTGPQGASATRSLPCLAARTYGSPMPNPSPTPNLPTVTPKTLTYRWPAAAQQSFVATEWGYTHWFASTTGSACGGTVASYPDVLPSPYSPAYAQAEADASPPPPLDTPYSYPNSNGESMNDAPAAFPLDPAAAGLCSATVADDFGQQASSAVQVMGWLTAAYGGKNYTHLSSPQLALPASALAQKGAVVTIALSKTYDAEPLQPQVAFGAACSQYVTIASAAGTTPKSPAKTPATASITLTLSTVPQSTIACGGTIYDQYTGSKGGEGVPFNATIAPQDPTTWPLGVRYPMPNASPLSGCAANQPKAMNAGNTAADENDLSTASGAFGGEGAAGPYGSDADGCIVYNASESGGVVTGTPVDMTSPGAGAVSVLVNEPGYTGNFSPEEQVPGEQSCGVGDLLITGENQTGPTGNYIGEGLQPTNGVCYFALADASGNVVVGQNTVSAEVVAPCTTTCYALMTATYESPYTYCGDVLTQMTCYYAYTVRAVFKSSSYGGAFDSTPVYVDETTTEYDSTVQVGTPSTTTCGTLPSGEQWDATWDDSGSHDGGATGSWQWGSAPPVTTGLPTTASGIGTSC